MLYRFAKYKGMNISTGENSPLLIHSDMPDWAVDEMVWVFSNGVLQEKEGGEPVARGTITRTELTEALKKMELHL